MINVIFTVMLHNVALQNSSYFALHPIKLVQHILQNYTIKHQQDNTALTNKPSSLKQNIMCSNFTTILIWL